MSITCIVCTTCYELNKCVAVVNSCERVNLCNVLCKIKTVRRRSACEDVKKFMKQNQKHKRIPHCKNLQPLHDLFSRIHHQWLLKTARGEKIELRFIPHNWLQSRYHCSVNFHSPRFGKPTQYVLCGADHLTADRATKHDKWLLCLGLTNRALAACEECDFG